MPITVRHDVPIAASAGLAALAGTAQAQIRERDEQRARGRIAMQLDAGAQRQHAEIQASAEGQQEQIEAASAQAHQQAEYAKDRMGYAAGLQGEMQEQKFGQEMERMEAEANQQAQQFEWKMDVTAKKLMNEARKHLVFLNSPEAQDLFDPGQLEQLRQEATLQLQNPLKTPTVREPQPDDKFPEGQKLNQPFMNDQGALVVREIGSRGQLTERVVLKPSETQDGIRYAAEQKQAVEDAKVRSKELDARQERIEDIREFRYDLGHTKDEDTGKFPGGFEIDRRTLERFGGQAIEEFRGQDLGRTAEPATDEPSTEELEQELQRRVDIIKQAKAFLKKMEKEYKNVENIPPEILIEIMKADEIVRQAERR